MAPKEISIMFQRLSFQRMSVLLLATTVLMAICSQPIFAQRGGFGGAGFGAHGGFSRGGGIGLHHQFSSFAGGFLADDSFLYPDYYAGDSSPLAGAPPQVVIMQPANLEPNASTNLPARKSAPLLIEWQGNRYVRFGGNEDTEERRRTAPPDYSEATGATMPNQPHHTNPAPDENLRPAILVYRDGHQEEISYYVIADGMVYANGNYWSDGHWTKRIPLSAIDTEATMQANQQRGIRFQLPSASNVVVASF